MKCGFANSVIARSEVTKQSRAVRPLARDCFAPLAMTHGHAAIDLRSTNGGYQSGTRRMWRRLST
jgi:hypothetical protein